ncbi:VanZ family protein [Noviherbaspirillum aerium]|uniref:VanZ family protein n=1 Tax=Noviherbaspirillum aerium TaxID=2588497 RepID=UPI00124C1FD1|nr:VanZ family protein [Noviherbaspirillum aerium]
MLPNEEHQAADAASASLSASASTFARAGLLMYTFLIAYASLYPLSSWQSKGLPLFGFLFMPMPHYWTGFDVITNIVGYVPFGALVVFSLHPHLKGAAAAIVAIFCGMLLSGAMEATQTLLPNRVSSNLDFLTNITGSGLGAVAGVLLSPFFLEHSRLLRRIRRAWLIPEAGRGLIVIGLWPLAQIYPQGYLFGHGQFLPILSDWLSAWMERPIDLLALASSHIHLTVQQFWLAETLITACGMTTALLMLSCMLRKQAPRAVLLVLLAVGAAAVKLLANALLFTPANTLAWLTPGAEGGLLIGAMMVGGLAFAPPAAQRRLAIFSLMVSLVAINMVPANPYFIATLQTWVQGRFLNFNGAAHFLSVVWPLFALWFLLHPMHRLKR